MNRSCAGLFLILVAGCRAADSSSDGILVATATVRNITPSVTVIGTMEYARPVDVSTEVAGRIVRTYVREGDRVKAGQPLALIDTEPLAAAAAVARVRRSQAMVAIERLVRDSATAVEHAETLGQLARTVSSGATPIELRTAQRAAEQAGLAVADARLNERLAVLALVDAERALSRAMVRAPFAGVVVRILSPSGAVAVTGTASAELAGIARIADPDSVWVRMAIPVQHMLGVRRGQPVLVRSLDATRGFSDSARVVSVNDDGQDRPSSGDRAGASATPTVTVLAAMARRRLPADWPMGVPVEAVVQTGVAVRGLAVPLAAVVPAAMGPGGREGVWAVADERTRFVPLTTGPDDGVWTLTTLTPGRPLLVAVGSTATLLLHGEGRAVTVRGQWQAP